MNWIDKALEPFAPQWVFSRVRHRAAIQAYEAARSTRTHKVKGVKGSANVQVGAGALPLREQARRLDEDHDIAHGLLDTLVKYVIGPNGISVEPQPKDKDGNVHAKLAWRLAELWENFSEFPEVTLEFDRVHSEQLVARTWFRDGECFGQLVAGRIPSLDHRTLVPLSIELLEPDFVPLDFDDARRGIKQGIQRDAWGRATNYWVYKEHPGELSYFSRPDLKPIRADRMLHIKQAHRLHQGRGISVFAPSLVRLSDLKEYEESERIAARVAAAMTGYIKKGSPELYKGAGPLDDKGGAAPRRFQMAPGMIFDDLEPGEEVGTIESNRPSILLQPFRDAMLRATAAGTGTTFSSLARSFEGSYSSQRQELVDGFIGYQMLTMIFIGSWSRPVYRDFVQTAIAAGLVDIPDDVDMSTIYSAMYQGPAMIWIDPYKEAKANEALRTAGFESTSNIIRARGKNPDAVRQQILQEEKEDRAAGVAFSTSAKSINPGVDDNALNEK